MPAGVKRVPSSWAPRTQKEQQAWRTLATCLGYSTPYMQSATELGARVFRNMDNGEEEPCRSSTT